MYDDEEINEEDMVTNKILIKIFYREKLYVGIAKHCFY